jgi:hypothetical protein
MKTLAALCALLLLVSTSEAQVVRLGARGSVMLPVGGLSGRFLSAPAGAVDLRWEGPRLSWGATIDYTRFTRENTDELSYSDSAIVGGTQYQYTTRLDGLVMDLAMWGMTVQGRYTVADFGTVEMCGAFGFGLYYWTFTRERYTDSIYVDTPTGPALATVLDVPSDSQGEWSGGINLGAEVRLKFLAPVWITLGGSYRVVIGELWPALAIDMENVSSMQMLEFTLGASFAF